MGEIVQIDSPISCIKSIQEIAESDISSYTKYLNSDADYTNINFQGCLVHAISVEHLCSAQAYHIFCRELKQKIIKEPDKWLFLVDDSISYPENDFFIWLGENLGIRCKDPFVNLLSEEIVRNSGFDPYQAAYVALMGYDNANGDLSSPDSEALSENISKSKRLLKFKKKIDGLFERYPLLDGKTTEFFKDLWVCMHKFATSISYQHTMKLLEINRKPNIFAYADRFKICLFDEDYKPDFSIPKHLRKGNSTLSNIICDCLMTSGDPDALADAISYASETGNPLKLRLAQQRYENSCKDSRP